jgi:hypothetical protein
MGRSKSISGIIFRYYNSGINDKVVCVIAEDGMRQVLLFKGVKSEKSKKSGFIELGNYVSLKFTEGYTLPIVTEVGWINENTTWRNEMLKVFFLEMACEVIDKVCIEEQENLELFHVFNEFIVFGINEPIFSIAILVIKSITAIEDDDQIIHTILSFGVSQPEDDTRIRLMKTLKFIIENKLRRCIKVDLTSAEKLFLFDVSINFFEHHVKKLKSSGLIRKFL